MSYDAVLFDNDGVLVTLVERAVLREAAARTFADFDLDPHPDDVEALTVGVAPDTLRSLAERYGVDRTAFWAARDRRSSEAQVAEVRAGRKRLYDDFDAVRSVAGDDTPMGIVSSNQQATVDFLLDHHDVNHLFETAYGREPTPESLELKKPNPHYLRRALADLDADPEATLFVGDSESDVVAADRAGLDSAFVRRPHRADAVLDADPTHELDGLDELPDLVDGG
ncbi:HAD family hydrolase [Halobium salinum]|uniref:HAD family hydrolase n=1 Tax=Halobium salinum TaxID=1364940 RepID=A0ABD5P9P3_9EURY|nr:HAD family hydrolase [Halobium salinum]